MDNKWNIIHFNSGCLWIHVTVIAARQTVMIAGLQLTGLLLFV